MRAPGVVAFLAALFAAAVASAEGSLVCQGHDLSSDPAVKPRYEAFADDLVNSDGILWKIEKDGLAPSYVFGTIHSTQPGPVALAREAAGRLSEAKTVATELGGPLDARAKIDMNAALLSAAISPDRDTFADSLSTDEAALAERYLTARGISVEMARRLKLWFLALTASLPSCEAEGEARGLPEVDDLIARLAKERGLPVVALETIGEQVETIERLPLALAARVLVASARAPEADDDAYVTLLALYARKRPAEAIAVLDAAPGEDEGERAAERDFTKWLLGSRNETMAARSAPLLAKGGAFIAVGALHLSGKDGLVERFRALGYRVGKVW